MLTAEDAIFAREVSLDDIDYDIFESPCVESVSASDNSPSAKYSFSELPVLRDAVSYAHTETTKHESDDTEGISANVSQLHKRATYPPVLVPPMRSK